jgi:hypothetical protein
MFDGVRASTGGTALSWPFPVPARPDARIAVATQTELTALRGQPVARPARLPRGQLRAAIPVPGPLSSRAEYFTSERARPDQTGARE